MESGLFDAHCYVGRFTGYQEGFFHSPADLLREMDHFGIAEALVVDTLARELDPRAGNERILNVCRNEPRLHPAWSLAPPVQSLPCALEELPRRMAEAGVHAVWMYPAQLHFTLAEWNVGPILKVLEEHRIPLFVDSSPALLMSSRDVTDWDALVRLCQAHPQLPVVATEARMYWPSRRWFSALAAAPNLRLELSPFWSFQGIEFACREFGAHRLLFGTRLPIRDAGGTVEQLWWAEVSDSDRRAIGGGNLRRLLAWGSEDAEVPPSPIPSGEISQTPVPSLAGERLVDMHAHLGYGAPYFIPDNEPAEVVRQARRHGVEKLLTFAFTGLNADWTWGNDLAAQAQCEHPDLILPLAAVHLWDLPEMQAEMARCCDGLGFWGVKLHPWWNGYPETGPHVREACAFCHERGLILTNHHSGPASALDSLAQEFPNAQLITGHLVWDDEYVDVVKRRPNVYVGTCLPISRPDLTRAVGRLPIEKLLFGSDVPDLPIPLGLGPILRARLPDETKRRILGLNALDLLDRVRPNVATCARH